MKRILLAAVASALAGCSPPPANTEVSDAAAVVRSVVEAVENAPAVAEARGGWPETPFPGGSVGVSAAERVPGGMLEYVVMASLPSRAACTVVVRSVVRGSERFVLDGGTYLTEEMPRRGKRLRRTVRRLCSAASFPAKLEVTRRVAYPARAN